MTASVIGALRVNLSIDSAEFKRGLTEAERASAQFNKAIGSAMKAGLAAFAAGAAAAAVALVSLTKASFETVSAQVDLANRVGASVAAVQTLEQAAKLSGASNEALAKTLGTLNAKLGEAATKGAGPAYEAIQKLGLSVRELSEADADVRIKMIADAMDRLNLSTQEQASTLKALGVKQQEIINLFQEGSSAIDNARAELQDWGVLLSDIDAAKIEEAADAWDKMGAVLEGVGNQIAVKTAPYVEMLAVAFGDAFKKGHLAADTLTASLEGLDDLIVKETAEVQVLMRWWQELQEVVGSFRIGQAGGVDWEALSAAHASAAADIERIWTEIDVKLQQLSGPDALLRGVEDYLNRANPLVQSLDKYLANMQSTGEGGDGTTDADRKEAEKRAEELAQYQDQMAQKLATLQESLLSEREAELAAYDQRQSDLEDFHNQGLLSETEYRDLLARNHQDYAAKVAKIDEDAAKNQQRLAWQQEDTYWRTAESGMAALNALFGENKIIASAMAAVDTAAGIAQAMRLPFPLNWAEAAARAATGAAQIAAINSTSKGGGGGRPSVSGGGSSAAAAAPAQTAPAAGSGQTMFLRINGDSFNQESVRALANQLIEFQRDGGKVVLEPT